MKAVILAGGLPSTITEDREGIPKPMVEIGEKPILWHIMKNLSHQGIREFIICAGYKMDLIKNYFNDFYIYHSDITVDLKSNTITIHKNVTEDWKVTVVDTGLNSTTSERVARIKPYIDEDFLVTYGDCLSDVNIHDIEKRHMEQGKVATMVVARPTGRNSTLNIDEDGILLEAHLQQLQDGAWVNTGTYLFKEDIFRYFNHESNIEAEPISSLIKEQQVVTYRHSDFWRPVETKRDKEDMIHLWNEEMAPWKNWQE